eukprot:TRINITY_DN15028_c0_g1_i1.p1 TRINITY_DN15028_c0_g1~~TRINITY_DN15028_c0_g1_i1.p1  ORF type:complete len:361 (-),score=78.73 TRINITY_DN15028_c0_g1_i1:13-1095(-)
MVKKTQNKKRLNSGGNDAGGPAKARKAGKAIDSDDDLGQDAKVTAKELDLDALKEAAAEQQALEKEQEDPLAEAGNSSEPTGPADPYLLADAAYIQKDTRWRNKQRTLCFCSRGVTARFRHLCDDIRKMLPHHKSEPKFEKRASFNEINEVCELKSCNNVVFFEARKREDLYMWVGRVPSGPTMKFQVLNIHTTQEVKLAGNCLLGSRPILYFDKHFGELSFLKLIKGLFTQAFGTPRNHPKSKPFHDHVMCFYWLDKKIWFRHYQITPETPDNLNDPEKQVLTEIGPRFVLDPIRIFSGSFSGQTLYQNPNYFSPTALRSHAKKLLRQPYVKKLEEKADRKKRQKDNQLPPDPLQEAFI